MLRRPCLTPLPMLSLLLGLALSACATFPELDSATRALPPGNAPVLLPIDTLITQAQPGAAMPADPLAGRVAGLRARAAALRAR